MRTTLLLFFLAASAAAHPPVSVVIDSRGNVYYSDLKQVWRVAPGGGRSVAVGGVHTHELALDGQDNLFGEHLWYEGEKSDKWGHYVWRMTPDGRVGKIVGPHEGFLKDYSFVRDRAGTMYWADREQNTIRKRTPDGRITAMARSGFTDVRWMHATPGGTVYLIDHGDLVRITPDGKLARIAKGLAKRNPLTLDFSIRHAIMGIWTDRQENVYIAHSSDGEVKRISRDGKVTTVLKSKGKWRPTGGAFAPDGTLWVLECGVDNAVRVRAIARGQWEK